MRWLQAHWTGVPHRGVGIVFGMSIVFTAVARAQDRPAVPETVGAQAQRLTRLLELPERCSESWRALLQLRMAAATPLALSLNDPRPDVAVRAAWLLGMLGRDAEMALPALQRGAKGKESQVACACKWALDRIAFRGTLLTDFQHNLVLH